MSAFVRYRDKGAVFCDVVFASLKLMIYTSLLILRKTLHGCSLLDNAGAYSPEQPLSTINALPKSFFSPTETCILNGHGYNCMLLMKKCLT